MRSPTFPGPASNGFSLPITPWNNQSIPDNVRSVLNCSRVIARILPLIWEDDVDCRWLWEELDTVAVSSPTGNNGSRTVLQNENQPQFIIDDDEDEEPGAQPSMSSVSRRPANAEVPPKPKSKSLMVEFLDALIDGLFHVGFTLPLDATESAINRTSYLIWYVH